MLRWISILFATSVGSPTTAQRIQDVLPSLTSTYNIQAESASGTCFLLKNEVKQYFFTAAHLFQKSRKAGDIVQIKMVVNNQVLDFDAKVFPHPNVNVDIAMFTLDRKIDQGEGLDTSEIGVDILGGLAFYGFPLTNMGTEVAGIKYPLVKRATVSGIIKYLGVDVLLLDGHNNHGFSGGPVISYNANKNKAYVVAIISGYFFEPRKLKAKDKSNEISFDENSGIIISYETKYITDILRQYP